MINIRKIMILILLTTVSISVNARKASHTRNYVWDKKPIEIDLPIGKRKMIMFEHNVKLLKDFNGMDIQKLQNVLYIKALNEFGAQELYIKDEETNEIIMLSLSAKSDVNDIYNVSITSAKAKGRNYSDYAVEPKTNDNVNYLTLTRYVIQTLFSSGDSKQNTANVTRVPMYTKKHINLVYENNVLASPVGSWHGGNIYVTAVQLNNIGSTSTTLDPRASLKGNWLTATFYPSNHLKAKGSSKSSTLAVITSATPFNEALYSVKGYVR